MADYVVGIDLGTTNSCASIFVNGKVKLLENAEGKMITPSCIFYEDLSNDKVIVGHNAKKMMENNPEYGVYAIKRLIGRDFDDIKLQNQLRNISFNVGKSTLNRPVISIKQNAISVQKTPEEISSAILKKIKADISKKLGCLITKAVITIPAYFNSEQRRATLEAAKKAGFTVLKLLNEPTAAALSYFYEKPQYNDDENLYFLVYDLGGGTFDVAILKKTNHQIETIAVDGDTHLGGTDFDALLFDHVCKHLIKKYDYDLKKERETDYKSYKIKVQKLFALCEEAKEILSFMEETTLILNGFVKGFVVNVILKRNQFGKLAQKLFQKTIDIVDACLKSANVTKEQITDVILSGGSTRIPKIQNMLSDYFDGKNVNTFAHPDHCIAEGAAIQAALLSTNSEQDIENINIKDVTPLSLSSDNWANETHVIIEKNSPIPARGEKTYCTARNNQTAMIIQIFEGERSDARKNHILGEFIISNLTPAPPGQCQVSLNLNLDHNGILTATAKEQCRENAKELKIEYTRGGRSDEEINNSLKDAENNMKEDGAFLRFARKKMYLLQYCTNCIYNIEEKNLIKDHHDVYDLCNETMKKAEDFEIEDEEKIESLIQELEGRLNALVCQYSFSYIPDKGF